MEVLNLLNTDPELLNGLVYGPEKVRTGKKLLAENRVKVLDKPSGNVWMEHW